MSAFDRDERQMTSESTRLFGAPLISDYVGDLSQAPERVSMIEDIYDLAFDEEDIAKELAIFINAAKDKREKLSVVRAIGESLRRLKVRRIQREDVESLTRAVISGIVRIILGGRIFSRKIIKVPVPDGAVPMDYSEASEALSAFICGFIGIHKFDENDYATPLYRRSNEFTDRDSTLLFLDLPEGEIVNFILAYEKFACVGYKGAAIPPQAIQGMQKINELLLNQVPVDEIINKLKENQRKTGVEFLNSVSSYKGAILKFYSRYMISWVDMFAKRSFSMEDCRKVKLLHTLGLAFSFTGEAEKLAMIGEVKKILKDL